jgi:outer membrane receptor protein involved in Fe transport
MGIKQGFVAIAVVVWAGLPLGITFGASSAMAQSSGSAPMEEIVVTAQRREQAINDVPQAVQALSGQNLKDANVVRLADVIDMIPGASQVTSISAGSTAYQIRAIAPAEGLGEGTVGYYVDNLAFAMPALPYAPAIDLFDTDRVEVLRGPSGTLYGLGSLGGTVKTITRDPVLDAFELSARTTSAWSDDASRSYSGDIMVNAPIIDDRLAIRGVLNYRKRGGYSELLAFDKDNGNPERRRTGRIKLLAQPTDKLSIKLAYWDMKSRQDFFDRVTFANPPRTNNTFGRGASDYEFVIGDIDYDLGFGVLQSTTGYVRAKLSDDNNGSIALPVGSFESQIPQDSKVWNQDLRISGTGMADRLDYIVGIFYQDGETGGGQKVILPENTQIPGNVGLETSNDNVTDSESWAVYGEVTYRAESIPVAVTLGLRYYEEKRSFDQNSLLRFLGTGVTIETVGTTSTDENSLNPRLNVAWHPTDDGMIYLSATKGFRSGMLNSNALVSAANAALGTSFDANNEPDALWNYELGSKWTLAGGALDVGAALYYIDWSDAQVAISPAAQFIIVPIGDVEGVGLDLEATWRTPISGLTLSMSGNINETELNNVDPLIQASTSPRLVYMKNDNQLVGTTKRTFASVLNYRRTIGSNGWMMNYNLRYSYRGKQQSSYDGRYAPSLNMMSTRLAFETERYELSVFADNLTDEGGPISVPGGQNIVPFPRTFGVGLQVNL